MALAFMLDIRNHPILIHCNKGKVIEIHHFNSKLTHSLKYTLITFFYIHSCNPNHLSFFFLIKHRTGCLVGLLRKFCGWTYSSIFDEYRRFSHPKSRAMDQQFIELFDMNMVVYSKKLLPSWPEICL